MNSWNGLDFLIFLIFASNLILGMQRGASREIISMMCLSVALIFTIRFTVPVAMFFNKSPLIKDVADNNFMQNFMVAIGAGPLTADLLMEIMYSISLLICFVGTFSICEAGLNVTGVHESFSFPYATLSRKVGAALGFTRGYIIVLIFLSILQLHLLKNNPGIPGADFVSGSYFANLFRSSTVKLDQMITARNPEVYQQLFENKEYNASQVIEQLKGSLPKEQQQFLQPGTGTGAPGTQPQQPTAPVNPHSQNTPSSTQPGSSSPAASAPAVQVQY